MTQDLRKEMEAYSNERIINNIKQQEFFSPEAVVIAQEIALKRNIMNQNTINQFHKPNRITRQAKSINQSYTNANRQTRQASNFAATRSYDNSQDSGAGGIVTILFVVLFLIRIVLLFAANS